MQPVLGPRPPRDASLQVSGYDTDGSLSDAGSVASGVTVASASPALVTAPRSRSSSTAGGRWAWSAAQGGSRAVAAAATPGARGGGRPRSLSVCSRVPSASVPPLTGRRPSGSSSEGQGVGRRGEERGGNHLVSLDAARLCAVRACVRHRAGAAASVVQCGVRGGPLTGAYACVAAGIRWCHGLVRRGESACASSARRPQCQQPRGCHGGHRLSA